jgi:hypothetical protein
MSGTLTIRSCPEATGKQLTWLAGQRHIYEGERVVPGQVAAVILLGQAAAVEGAGLSICRQHMVQAGGVQHANISRYENAVP